MAEGNSAHFMRYKISKTIKEDKRIERIPSKEETEIYSYGQRQKEPTKWYLDSWREKERKTKKESIRDNFRYLKMSWAEIRLVIDRDEWRNCVAWCAACTITIPPLTVACTVKKTLCNRHVIEICNTLKGKFLNRFSLLIPLYEWST